jgi:hypothetical protein
MLMDENIPPSSSRQCSQSKCKATLPNDYKWKSCERCRERDRVAKKKKRQHENDDNIPRKRLTPSTLSALGRPAEKAEHNADSGDNSENGSNDGDTVSINNHLHDDTDL